MHPVHKTRKNMAEIACLTRSLTGACDQTVVVQENAPHTHNPLALPQLAPPHRRANPLLSLLAAPVTNFPFRDCSLSAVELSRTPLRYL
jgi:hypothetical protein